MLDSGSGCRIWTAGWSVRPHAAGSEGASEHPGSLCRAAMRKCWDGVGGSKHPRVSLLPSPSYCGSSHSGFTTFTNRKECQCMTVLPSCSPAGWWDCCSGAWTDTPGAPPITASTSTPSPQRISLTRQQPSGTAGIPGETGKGCFSSWLDHCEVSPGMVCRAVEAERILTGLWEGLCCCCTWGAGLHPCQALQKSSFLEMEGAVPRPQGAGTGSDSGSRAGCWRAGTYPSTWEACRDGEGREERPRREAKQGVAPGALIMHYWKHLAWDVGACTGCTPPHTCAQMHGYRETYTHTSIYGYVCISTCMHPCVHTRSCVPTYPYMCTYVPLHVQTHIHRHKCLHTHVDAPRHVCAYGWKHVKLHVYTRTNHMGISVEICTRTCACACANKHRHRHTGV